MCSESQDLLLQIMDVAAASPSRISDIRHSGILSRREMVSYGIARTATHLLETFCLLIASNPMHSTLAFTHADYQMVRQDCREEGPVIETQVKSISKGTRIFVSLTRASPVTHTSWEFPITLMIWRIRDIPGSVIVSKQPPREVSWHPHESLTLLFLLLHLVHALIALATRCSNGLELDPPALPARLDRFSEGTFIEIVPVRLFQVTLQYLFF